MYYILYHCHLHYNFFPIAISRICILTQHIPQPILILHSKCPSPQPKLIFLPISTAPFLVESIYPNCTLRVDCLLTGYVAAELEYYPSFAGNLLYLALFFIFLIAQILRGIVWKTWNYSIAMILGLVLECVGYIGRLL